MKLLRLLGPASLLVVTACTPELTAPPTGTIEETTFAASLNINLANFSKSSTGLYSQDATVGSGAAAVSGNHLTVHYTGYYTNGNSFDTSLGKAAFGFTLGTGSVIKGWDEGLVGMKVGGTRKLIIPPELAYGAGSYNGIPPNSILVFTIQLVSIP